MDKTITRALELVGRGQFTPDEQATIRAGAAAVLGRGAAERDRDILDRLVHQTSYQADLGKLWTLLDTNGTSHGERRLVELALRITHYAPEPEPRPSMPKLDAAIEEAGQAVATAEAAWNEKVDALHALNVKARKSPKAAEALRPAIRAAAEDLTLADQVCLRARARRTALMGARSQAHALNIYEETRR
jgi:hypothetical protein